MARITAGQTVTFQCSSFLEDGSCLDDPKNSEPLIMRAGTNSKTEFRRIISNALLGMTVNERKRLRVPPKHAFGEFDTNKVFRLTADAGQDYTVGESLELRVTEPGGDRIVDGVIVEVADGQMEVDTNHPLAGQTIVVSIQVISIRN